MAVICATCGTENRDAAMFCHGCARKLPAFVATAPSLLETMRARDAAAAARPTSRLASVAKRAVREPLFPLAAALLIAALTVGWYARTAREPAKPAQVASAAPAKAPAPPKVAVATAKPDAPKPEAPKPETPKFEMPQPVAPKAAEPVPLVASLSPGEIELPAARPVTSDQPGRPGASEPSVALATPTAPERRPPRAATPPRSAALDPRHGCETLNFIFAARCEAAHCEKPEYARHPRCNVVREARQRDELHRNPTLGF